MAAATPSRPSICVIPSSEVLSLAEELQGLGGNDVALAEATSVSINDGASSEISSSWINAGFNATLAPLNGADALQMEQLAMLMMSLGSRLAATNRLAFISAAVGHSFKAVDALGRPVSPIAGLKSAAAVEITSSTDLQELLQVALPQTEHVQDRIIALQAFSPSASTLSTFAAIISSSLSSSNPTSSVSSSISRQAPTLALLEEVAQLHVLGRPGEHILRSAQLSLFNQIAAPLVGGNVRLFLAIDEHNMGRNFLEKMSNIKSVCSKVVLPASELRWVSMAVWQAALQKQQEKEEYKKKKRGAGTAVVSTHHQVVHPTQSTSSTSSQQSVERRRQQRLRASSSLQLAASRLAIKAASGSSSPAPQAADSSDVSIDQSSPTSKHPCQQLRVEVPEGFAESQEERRSDVAESVDDFAPAVVAVEAIESSAQPPTSPASVAHSASWSRILDEDAFEAARRNIRESTRSLPVNRAPSDLTSPSGAVQYGPTGSYSAAYNIGRGGGGSVLDQATSEISFGGGGGYSPQLGNAAAAAAAAGAGGSSFSAPRTSDVFSFDQPPSSMAAEYQSPAMDYPKSRIQDDDEELCVDVSLQSGEEEHYASPYPLSDGNLNIEASDGHRGENAWVEEAEELDCNDYGAPRSLSFISSMPASTATLQKELEQERRVNAVLLRQLQDAEKRAAEATASAAVATSLARAHENTLDMAPIRDPSDFQGMLGALHAERRHSAVLKEDTLSAEEAKLSAQIGLASMQRELSIAKARCRGLERQSSLAAAFAECEQALVAAQQESTALKKENAELALKVANTEVDNLLAGSTKKINNNTVQSEDASSCIMADMHRRLSTAHGVAKRLREELAVKEEIIQQVKQQIRSSEVSKRTAEDAIRRNQQLRDQLEWTESELRAQCLAAAEAAALAEEIERSRQETEQELHSSREVCQQLDDVCDALRRQMDLLKGGGGLHSRALRCLGDGNPVNSTPPALPSSAC